MNEFEGKVAVITGGAGGIGLATASLLLHTGSNVVIADLGGAHNERTKALLNDFKANAAFVPTDVTDLASVSALMAAATHHFGGMDILFNNAGVLGGNRFPESDPQAWRRAIEVNIVGTMNCIHAAVPYLKNRCGSRILNMGSTAGLKASFLDPAYAMTKAAIVSLTRSLTFLLDEAGININCLCPTLVKTELARNSSSNFSETEFARFYERRGNRNERPSLTAEAVAEAAVKLLRREDLNGYCCEMTLENSWNLIPPVLPQKV